MAAARWLFLAGAGRSEQEHIGALFELDVAGGERRHRGLADHRDGLEVEGRECFADRQTGFCKMALDAAAAALRRFMLGECGKESRRRAWWADLSLRGRQDPAIEVSSGGQCRLPRPPADTRRRARHRRYAASD